MKHLHTFLLLFCANHILAQSNNACERFSDYINLQSNPHCFYNPDIDLTVPEMILRHGYPVETYIVTTEDGYILTVFRIPHGRGFANQTLGPPVFLQHGIGANSVIFVDIGRKSLAFVMADNGYDVWLGNFRGCKYSTKHLHLSYNSHAYWNFTLNEIGKFDVPAELELVAEKTKQKVFYIGYSMGTTAYYIYNIIYPEKAKNTIRISISLAPIAFLRDIKSIYKVLTIPIFTTIVKNVLDIITNGAIDQPTPSAVAFRKLLCLPHPIQMKLCAIHYSLLFGMDSSQEDPTTLPVSTIQGSDAIGVKIFVHFGQLVHSGRFRQYDYGKHGNDVEYGTDQPPQYNLSKINVPNYFIRGNGDPLATKKNVEKTYSALPTTAKPFGDIYLVPYDGFDHMDFARAKDVKELLYDHVVDFLSVNGQRFW